MAYIIAKEYNNIKVHITKDYVIIRKYSVIKFMNLLICIKQKGTNVNAGRKAPTALSHIFLIKLSRQYFNIKDSLETTLYQIS